MRFLYLAFGGFDFWQLPLLLLAAGGGIVWVLFIATANRSMSNASVGVLLPVGGIGAILMPYITGAVAEYTGIRGGMLCSAAALVIMIAFSILVKRSETDASAGQA